MVTRSIEPNLSPFSNPLKLYLILNTEVFVQLPLIFFIVQIMFTKQQVAARFNYTLYYFSLLIKSVDIGRRYGVAGSRFIYCSGSAIISIASCAIHQLFIIVVSFFLQTYSIFIDFINITSLYSWTKLNIFSKYKLIYTLKIQDKFNYS